MTWRKVVALLIAGPPIALMYVVVSPFLLLSWAIEELGWD